jgi:hypothetical protein
MFAAFFVFTDRVVLRPCMSPCRSDYIISARVSREARRVVSEGNAIRRAALGVLHSSLLIVRTDGLSRDRETAYRRMLGFSSI